MSQAIFAHRTQLTLATVVNLEHGKTWPSLRVLRDLSKFMGWSAEEIGLFVLTAQPLNKGPGRRRKFDERREDAIKAAREAVQKWAGPAATG